MPNDSCFSINLFMEVILNAFLFCCSTLNGTNIIRQIVVIPAEIMLKKRLIDTSARAARYYC